MNYITLDLEWNQAYLQKALAVQKQLSCRLRGEVIQIGAVKMDENMNICGSYQIIVKPKYFKKLHRHVSKLTGITQEQMDMGTPLTEAAQRFKRWCGRDFCFLTWGPDDVPMLKENFNINSISSDWIENVYDLQKIFNTQTDGSSKQRSLEYAMEYFNIPQNLPAHDALNDAFFTAKVAKALDVPLGVASYSKGHGEFLLDEVIGDADAGEDGYVTISELLDDEQIIKPLCPICSSVMERENKALHSKGQKYTIHFSCKEHGDMLLALKLHRNFNETWRAKKTIKRADEDSLKEYLEALERSEIRKKVVRRRRPKRRSTDFAQK